MPKLKAGVLPAFFFEIMTNKNEASENKKVPRKASFSNSIVNLVGLCFGIVFLVIFIFCIIFLLSQFKDDLESYYSRVGILFGIFLLTYLGVSLLVAKRIKKMINPLDQLAYGLLENKIKVYGDSDDFSGLADSLKKEMTRLEKMSHELKETKESLTAISTESEKNQEYFAHHSQNMMEAFTSLVENEKQLNKFQTRCMELRDDIRPVQDKLFNNRKNMLGVVKGLDNSVMEGLKNSQDSVEDLRLAKEAEETMGNMISESIELVENLYNDLSYMQDMMNKLTLYATNTSLELARSGAFGVSTASALDDMKMLTNEISARNDEAALLSIRVKNSIKLAKEQANICEEKLEAGRECLLNNEETLKNVLSNTNMSRNGFELSANSIGLIMEKIFDLEEIFEEEGKVLDDMHNNVASIDQELHLLSTNTTE